MTEHEKEALEKLLQMTFWAYLIDAQYRDALPIADIVCLENSFENETSFPIKNAQVIFDYIYPRLSAGFTELDKKTSIDSYQTGQVLAHILRLFSQLTRQKNADFSLMQDLIMCFYNPVNIATDQAPLADRPAWHGADWLLDMKRWYLSAFVQQNKTPGAVQKLVSIVDVLGRLQSCFDAMRAQKKPLERDSLFWQHHFYVTSDELLTKNIDETLMSNQANIRKILCKLNQLGYLDDNLTYVTRLHIDAEIQLSAFVERRQALESIRKPIEARMLAASFSLEDTQEYCNVLKARIQAKFIFWKKCFAQINPKAWQQEPDSVKKCLSGMQSTLQDALETLHKRMGQYETCCPKQREGFMRFVQLIFAGHVAEASTCELENLFTARDFSTLNSAGSFRWRAVGNYLLCLSDIEHMLTHCQDATQALSNISTGLQAWSDKRRTLVVLRDQLQQKMEPHRVDSYKKPSALERTLAHLNRQTLQMDTQDTPEAPFNLLTCFIDAFSVQEDLKYNIARAQQTAAEIKLSWQDLKNQTLPECALAAWDAKSSPIQECLDTANMRLNAAEASLNTLCATYDKLEESADTLARRYHTYCEQTLETLTVWQARINALYTAAKVNPLTRKDNRVQAILRIYQKDDQDLAQKTGIFIESQRAFMVVQKPHKLPAIGLEALKKACKERKKELKERFKNLQEYLISGLNLHLDTLCRQAPTLPDNLYLLPTENCFSLPLKESSERFQACQRCFTKALSNFSTPKSKPEKLTEQLQIIESHLDSVQSAVDDMKRIEQKHRIMQLRLESTPYHALLQLRGVIAAEIERLRVKSDGCDPRIAKLVALEHQFGEEFSKEFTQTILDEDLDDEKQGRVLQAFATKLQNAVITCFQSQALQEMSRTVQHKILQILRALLAYFPVRSRLEDSALGKSPPFATLSELTLFRAAKDTLGNLSEAREQKPRAIKGAF